MRKVVLLIAALALFAPISVPAQAAQPDICGRLHEVAFANSVLCTHGPDPAPGPRELALADAAFDTPGAPAPCVKTAAEADYTTGRRIRVLYGVPSDRTPSATNRALIPGWLAMSNDKLKASGATVNGTYVGQDYRFHCTGSPPSVSITDITLNPIGTDNSFTYDDLAASLESQGYTADNTDYVVFTDQLGSSYPYGGQGSIWGDTRPDPAVNLNNSTSSTACNSGPCNKVALVNVFTGSDFSALVFMHEVGHNLGAVQNDAPHASGGYHCYDEYDTMCYDDGGSYFTNGGSLQYLCPTDDGATSIWDCGRDDYYSVAAATINTAGTYLQRSWNLARSGWFSLIGTGGGGAPTVTAPTYSFAAGAVSGGTGVTKTIPVQLKWTASDTDGIASQVLQQSDDGGAWTNVPVAASARTLKRTLSLGHSHNFQIRATDTLGNTSTFAVGVQFDLVATQESGVLFSGVWNSTSNASYMGGLTRYTTARNAYGSLSFNARAVAWIASKGPEFGSATVNVDGGPLTTRNQYATGLQYRKILHRYSWASTGAHSIRVNCLATAGHPRCDVDAFALIV